MHIGRTTIVLLGSAALAGAARGQDGSEVAMNRTPANAQKFLAATPPETFQVNGKSFVREGDVSSADACTTQMSGAPGRLVNNVWVKGEVRTLPAGGAYLGIEGRKITYLPKGYAAQRAGLRMGDEIISVNGQPINSNDDLRIAMAKQIAAGGAAQIVYLHDGQTLTTSAAPVHGDNDGTIDVPVDPAPPSNLTIDWSKVQQVEAGGSAPTFYVGVKTPGEASSPEKWLSYSVAETRDRVMAAAQYLKTACDKSKELGF